MDRANAHVLRIDPGKALLHASIPFLERITGNFHSHFGKPSHPPAGMARIFRSRIFRSNDRGQAGTEAEVGMGFSPPPPRPSSPSPSPSPQSPFLSAVSLQRPIADFFFAPYYPDPGIGNRNAARPDLRSPSVTFLRKIDRFATMESAFFSILPANFSAP